MFVYLIVFFRYLQQPAIDIVFLDVKRDDPAYALKEPRLNLLGTSIETLTTLNVDDSVPILILSAYGRILLMALNERRGLSLSIY